MQSDVRDTEQQDITSGVNMSGDFITKSISTEDDVTAGKTSQIDLAGLTAGEEPGNSEDLKKAAIRDELLQMHRKDVFETITRLELEKKYPGIRYINSLMFTKCKFDAQGFFTKWKARLAGVVETSNWRKPSAQEDLLLQQTCYQSIHFSVWV